MNWLEGAKFALVGVVIAVIFSLGETYERSKWQERELNIAALQQEKDQANVTIANLYEQLKASKNEQYRPIQKEVIKEITSNNAYSCVIPDRGVQLLTSTIAIANGASKPNSSVSTDSKR